MQKIVSHNAVNGVQGNCFDTSARLLYRKEDSSYITNNFITKTKDGNILIPGFVYQTNGSGNVWPQLTKITPDGDTLWTKKIITAPTFQSAYIYRVFELNDQSLLMVGDYFVHTPVNGRQDLLMIKATAKGDLIWEKTFKSNYWAPDTTNGSVNINDCKQDDKSNIYLCGNINYSGFPRASLALKMDTAGTIQWSKGFVVDGLCYFTGIDVTDDKLTVLGTEGALVSTFLGLILNASTGDTLLTNSWAPFGDDIYSYSFPGNNFTKLATGNFVLSGTGQSDAYNLDSSELITHYGLAEFTPTLDFVRGSLFRSPYTSNSGDSKITVFEDGTGAFVRRDFGGEYSGNVVYGSFSNGHIVKERVLPYNGEDLNWVSNFVQLNNGGQLITNEYTDSAGNFTGIEVVKLHNSDTSGGCVGTDLYRTIVQPLQLTKGYFSVQNIDSNVLSEIYHPFTGIVNGGFTILSNCAQVSYCDSLKLKVPKNILCPNQQLNIYVVKNKACGATPLWKYDTTGVQFFTKIDDTTMSISFNAPWQGYIKAAINGCTLLQDSIKITVLQAPAQLKLGPDTVLCPGDTIVLNAKSGYATYKWQDGSSDSTYKVITPGKYFVAATNACGAVFYDTIIVAAHPPIPFNIGNDTAICRGDTVTVSAPTGFTNYSWYPNNQINSDTERVVQLFPSTTTLYKVTATFKAGCVVADSMLITVKPVPYIYLGNDTSFCQGQSITLDAGSGFTNYQWNTGANTEKIIVDSAGLFEVKALVNGCPAYDTLRVLAVSPLPAFSLGNDSTLCAGKTLFYTFNLANAVFLWSNGSNTDTFTVANAGTYWLKVIQGGCSLTDTVAIQYKPLPTVSLGNDTTLCQGSTLLLNAFYSDATYTWQDGSTDDTYLVKVAGTYSVNDALNGCTASSTIHINYLATPYFTLGVDTSICFGSQLILNPALNTTADYLWQDGSVGSSFTATQAGVYTLTTNNVCGKYADSISIATFVCKLQMPNAFTPNMDGKNDVFKVKYVFPVKKFSMVIFNRWGQKIYENSDITQGWDGNYNGNIQPPGTYIWMIDLIDSDNIAQHQHGTITLIR